MLAPLKAGKLNDFSVALCNGGKYAKQATPAGGLYWIADPAATSQWCANEWAVGIVPGWPQSLRKSTSAKLLTWKFTLTQWTAAHGIHPCVQRACGQLLACQSVLLLPSIHVPHLAAF